MFSSDPVTHRRIVQQNGVAPEPDVPMVRIGRRRRYAVALIFLALFSLSTAATAEQYTIPWFVHATPWFVDAEAGGVPEGVLRILNVTDESGSVEVYSIDDAGRRSGPASFTLDAWAAVEFTATDLQSGNAMLGLTGGIGAKVDDARLQIDTELRIVPLAYVRAADGTLSAMHDTVRAVRSNDGGFEYLVPIFNPSADTVSASQLRLINPGDAAASVTIGARDDAGAAATGGTVELTLAPGAARTLTAQQLEAGDPGLTGRLGAGVGKWRLNVSSDRPIQVVNVVMSISGHMNNLSTTAVAGPAPVDHNAFNERFLGSAIEFRTDSREVTIAPGEVIIAPGEVTFAPGPGDTFTVTAQSGGVTTTRTGRYGYAALGPDAGRMAVSYDDGSECAANLYFASRSAGWFANNCTAADNPDGYWVAGNWSVADDVDRGDGGEPIATTYGVDESLPGVPASGAFVPSVLSGGSVSATDGGTTINLNEGGYFELGDGTRYACASPDGCAIANGTVTRGTVTGTAAGTGEVDRFPTFRTAINPGDRTYAAGTAIDPLTLPEASSGNGTLRYGLSPNVPGLSFNAASRQLTGTPSTPGTYAMTYTVTDEDGDTDNLGFTITVSDGTTAAGSLGVCQVGMSLSSGQSCTYPGTSDEFSVNARGRGSFLGRLAGIRIRINNETINGREYDFEASHQGDGVWRIDRVAGSTEPPGGGGMEDSAPSFAAGAAPDNQMYTLGTAIDTWTLPAASGGDGTLTYSLTPDVPGLSFDPIARRLSGTPSTAASYNMTYSVTDEDGDADSLTFAVTVESGSTGGGEPTFRVGDTLSDLPTESWSPDYIGGSGTTVASDGSRIQLGSGGYFDAGGYRYMCLDAGGCEIINRQIVSGTIAKWSTAPVRLADQFPDSPLTFVYNENVVVMQVEEDVSMPGVGDSLASYSAEFYQWFEDEFDYLMFMSNLSTYEEGRAFPYAGIYFSVMNDTDGIGVSRFLDSRYGSAGRLRGVVHLPQNTMLRFGPSLHELLHAWANYAVPTTHGSHWGFSSANGQLGGFDIADLVDHGGGRWTAGGFGLVANGGNSVPYSPVELYLAGLALPEEVPDLWVAEDGEWLRDETGDFVRVENGYLIFTADTVRLWTIADIVAKNGERNPPMAKHRHQRAAVVLLVDDSHLPSPAILHTVSNFADWLALQGDDGSDMYNYYEATLGRGTLTLGGLSGFRKSEAAVPANLPASFGDVPPPRMTASNALCRTHVPKSQGYRGFHSVRPDEPFWDPYLGVRFSMADCVPPTAPRTYLSSP